MRKDVLVRLFAAAAATLTYSLACGMVGGGPGYAVIPVMLAVLAFANPTFGAFASIAASAAAIAIRSPYAGLITAIPLGLACAASFSCWWAALAVVAAASLAVSNQAMGVLAASLALAIATLLKPKKAAAFLALYVLNIYVAAFALLAGQGYVSRGMIVVHTASKLPGENANLLSILSSFRLFRKEVELVNELVYSLMAGEMLGIAQLLFFAIAGYAASSIGMGGSPRRKALAALVPAVFLTAAYNVTQYMVFGSSLPLEYSVPILFMAPSLAALLSSVTRAGLPERFSIRIKKKRGPSVMFSDVGGLDAIKQELRESIIAPLRNPGLAKKYGVRLPKGILLYGPPGCGKTLLMRALAREAGIKFIYVKCSDILSKWYGEPERRIAEVFAVARSNAPCILFFDEIDALARRRDSYSSDDVAPRILSIMLSEMDGLTGSEGVIVVASTNMPEVIDPALLRPGRFDKMIYVPPPDFKARLEIFKIHTRGMPLGDDVDLELLASLTEGYSGADIAEVCQEAARLAMRYRKKVVSMEEFREALRRVKPSITPEMIEKYQKFEGRGVEKLGKHPELYELPFLEQPKRVLDRLLDVFFVHHETYFKRYRISRPFTSVLVIGPPGCGKKTLIRTITEEKGLQLLEINCRVKPPEGYDKYVEEALRRNRAVIEVVGFGENEGANYVVARLSEVLSEKQNSLLLAVSSKPGGVVKTLNAVHFDYAVYVPPPDEESRVAFIKAELGSVGVSPEVKFENLGKLTAGYSLRALKRLCDEIKRLALIRSLQRGEKDIIITHSDISAALELVPPDISKDFFKEFEQFIETYKKPILGFSK